MAGKRTTAIPAEFTQLRLIQEPYQFLGARDSATDTHWHVPGGAILSRTEIEQRIGPCRLESVAVSYAQEPTTQPGEPRVCHRYSEEEEQSVRELVAAKRTHAEIGWALGRSAKSVAEFCRKAKITRKGV